MLGGEYFENQYTEYRGSAQGAPFDDIPTLNASGNENMTAYSYCEGYRIASFFGRVTYDYKRRYLFTAVARYDGISRLSVSVYGCSPIRWHFPFVGQPLGILPGRVCRLECPRRSFLPRQSACQRDFYVKASYLVRYQRKRERHQQLRCLRTLRTSQRHASL